MKWLCKLKLHKWQYNTDIRHNGCSVVSTYPLRECAECNKKQHATCDVMYGTTKWENGWPEFIMITYPPDERRISGPNIC